MVSWSVGEEKNQLEVDSNIRRLRAFEQILSEVVRVGYKRGLLGQVLKSEYLGKAPKLENFAFGTHRARRHRLRGLRQ